MRYSMLLLASFLLLAIPTHVGAQEQQEEQVPGDNFDLAGALDAFSKAKSLEAFEKTINDPDSQINNLDLNEDNEVDYVRVVEEVEDQTHVFILRVPVAEKEDQDIATIELEKVGEEDVTAQIVGDEDIYGPDVIFEPDDTATAYWKPQSSPVLLASASDDWYRFVPHDLSDNDLGEPYQLALVVVFRWPIVPILFAVGYSPWVSPYHWGYWPPYWSVWRPVIYSTWAVRRVRWHRAAWRHTAIRRSHRARSIHRAHHRSSAHARHRHHAGSKPGNRPGGGDRPGAGDRPGGGDRPGAGDRQAGSGRDRQATTSRDQSGSNARSRDGSAGSSRSRQATSGESTRSRGNSSFGGYSSSSRAKSNSSRGSTSRGGRGGGRGGGGGRRR